MWTINLKIKSEKKCSHILPLKGKEKINQKNIYNIFERKFAYNKFLNELSEYITAQYYYRFINVIIINMRLYLCNWSLYNLDTRQILSFSPGLALSRLISRVLLKTYDKLVLNPLCGVISVIRTTRASCVTSSRQFHWTVTYLRACAMHKHVVTLPGNVGNLAKYFLRDLNELLLIVKGSNDETKWLVFLYCVCILCLYFFFVFRVCIDFIHEFC